MAPILPRRPALSDGGASSGSASAIVAGAASGYHVLRIDGYSLTKSNVPNGQCCADYVSLFLSLKESVAGSVMAQLEFSFIDQVELQKPSHLCKLSESTFHAVSSLSGIREKFVKKKVTRALGSPQKTTASRSGATFVVCRQATRRGCQASIFLRCGARRPTASSTSQSPHGGEDRALNVCSKSGTRSSEAHRCVLAAGTVTGFLLQGFLAR
ncbi:hypothetical protein PR202_ga00263 [Eleusine coracana subsp. coracana]|uniref:Uncharacterized protein n=1 Tax=Eleusine coracana subsp. coracana TaxID=191504 RepID=A0AAV5BG09_ELECO|nr:hypothetical protein PR202_ga00263 [Eleusine coracana subsp. coracana]